MIFLLLSDQGSLAIYFICTQIRNLEIGAKYNLKLLK